jgi:hypothetical protein
MESRPRRRVLVHAAAIAAYVIAAIAFTWPLVLHLSDRLTGSPLGDTGNYVWNQWVFQHELIEHHSSPYFTRHLFGGARPANLSLHNYTTFQNLVALPLQPVLGVVATFNVVYLLMTVLTAYSMFLLAKDVSRSTGAAWLAGLLFAWSPFMVTRGTGHFSLVAAAPLPLLLLVLRHAATRVRVRDAFTIGVLVWWSASTDVYYAVYAMLIAALFIAGRVVSLRRRNEPLDPLIKWTHNVMMACLAMLIVAIIVSGGWEVSIFGRSARMRSLYTPVLALTVVLLARGAWHIRASLGTISRENVWAVARLAVTSGIVATILMTPVLYAFGQRFVAGDFNPPHIYWRSSPRGVDLVAFLLPNPNHPLTPRWIAEWLTSSREGDFLESVGSIPWVGLSVITVALWRGWRSSRCQAVLALAFVLLALGPFIYVAGVNTHIPGPWALLRYAPIIGLARTPARFVAVVMLIVAVMFATALAWLARNTRRPALVLSSVGVLLAAELLPLPRTLHSTDIPTVYRHVATAPEDVRLLELPFGVRDGTSSIGNFSAQTEFFQTAHGKTVMGGYLSRVSDRRRRDVQTNPVLHALARLSEEAPLSADEQQAFVAAAPQFIHNWNIGFVMITRWRMSDAFRTLAIESFQLELVEREGVYELYRPRIGVRP